jgi:rhodanese-related sulfurtransferase
LFVISNDLHKGVEIMTTRSISPQQLYEKMKKAERMFLLDVRAEEKYKEYRIEAPGYEAMNIPKTDIYENQNIHLLPKEAEIIVTCTTGNSAAKCGAILAEKNYTTLVLEGGITAWKDFLKTL